MDVNGSSKSTDITGNPPCGISLDLVQVTYFVPFKCNYSTSHLQSAGIMPGLQVSRCHVSLNFNRVCPTQEIMPVAFFSRKAHQCSQQKSTLLLCSAKGVRQKNHKVSGLQPKNRKTARANFTFFQTTWGCSETLKPQQHKRCTRYIFFWYKAADLKIWVPLDYSVIDYK